MKIRNNISDIIESYALNNTDNYCSHFDINTNINEILIKYILLIIDYIKLVSEKINIKKPHYYKYIFTRGLETINTVFKLLLYLTKNLDLTYYHSQKAFYFYVEFIEQISDDQNIFLQLSSREACMFVYKKTIFDINQEFRKNMLEYNEEEKKVMKTLDSCLYIYKNIINYCINNNAFIYENKITYTNMWCEKLKKYSNIFNSICIRFTEDNIETCYLFINNLLEQNFSIAVCFRILELFINKMSNNKIASDNLLYKKINNKICSFHCYENIMNDPVEIIEWFFE
jgi:hypothetical protein